MRNDEAKILSKTPNLSLTNRENYYLHTIIDTIPVGFFIAEANGRVILMNEEARRIWAGKVLPNEISDYVNYIGYWPETGERLKPEEWPAAQALLLGSEIKDVVIDIEKFDGSSGTVIVSASPIKDCFGNISGAMVAAQDITKSRLTERALLHSKQQLAVELRAAEYLQEVSTQFLQVNKPDVLYEQILDAALAIANADYASLQRFHPGSAGNGNLDLLGYRGFSEHAIRFWQWVNITHKSTCGIALQTRRRVAVTDVLKCDFMADSDDLATYLQTGIRAVQTTPLISRSGTLLGMFSTHWCEPHQLTASEIRSLDILARQAADLLERILVEEALRSSEQRFRALSTANLEALFRMSPDWNEMLYLESREFFANTNCPNSTWVEEYILPEDHLSFKNTIDEAIKTKTTFQLEHRVRQADGSIGWVQSRAVPILDEKDEIIEWFGTVKDITERKRREANLAFLADLTEDFSRLLTEEEIMQALGTRLGNYLNITSIVLNEINKAEGTSTIEQLWSIAGQPDVAGVYRILDYITGEFLRIDYAGAMTVIHNTQTDPHLDAARFAATSIHAYITVPFFHNDQCKYLFTVNSAFARHWREDEIELVREVTNRIFPRLERARTEAALCKSKEEYRILAEQLQEADYRKDEFIGVLSHEIRNPLAAIKMGLYLLEKEEYSIEKAKQAKQIMGRQVSQLSRLIDDLLDVTRINRNKIILKKQHIELSEIVLKTVEDYKQQFSEKEINLETKLAQMPLYLEADKARVVQIIGNLLHNAVKFTPISGFVSVILGKETTEAVLQIKDNGEGMTAEVLSNLFKPFMQADTSLYRGEGGLGLGLVLVKGLTELHGGSVTAHSDGLGKGAVFTIRLPLSAAAEHMPREEERESLVFSRRRILIIEDIKDVGESLRALLENEGHEIRLADNGRDGITLAREYHPEVVLCDIGLPVMDGYQVAKAFRSDDELKDLFLVALTGYARPRDVKQAKEAGFDIQVAKPVDLVTLRTILSRPN